LCSGGRPRRRMQFRNDYKLANFGLSSAHTNRLVLQRPQVSSPAVVGTRECSRFLDATDKSFDGQQDYFAERLRVGEKRSLTPGRFSCRPPGDRAPRPSHLPLFGPLIPSGHRLAVFETASYESLTSRSACQPLAASLGRSPAPVGHLRCPLIPFRYGRNGWAVRFSAAKLSLLDLPSGFRGAKLEVESVPRVPNAPPTVLTSTSAHAHAQLAIPSEKLSIVMLQNT